MKDNKLAEPFFDEMRELYGELERRQNRPLDSAAKAGVPAIDEGWMQAIRLRRLERFVDQIARNKAPVYGDPALLKKMPLDARRQQDNNLLLLNQIALLPCKQLVYSPYVSALFRACDEIGVSSQDMRNPLMLSMTYAGDRYKLQAELYDDVVHRVKALLATSAVMEEIRTRHAAAESDFDSAIQYTDHLFRLHPKIFVLRIDLGHQVSIPRMGKNEFPESGGERIKNEFLTLIKKLGRKNVYPEFIGYMAKLEFGRDRGYFMHAVLLLDGSHKDGNDGWIDVVEKAWTQKITSGEGTVYKCNSQQERDPVFPEKGVGLVIRGTPKHRAFERWIVGYAAKSSRYLRVKTEARQRTFFRGIIPKRRAE